MELAPFRSERRNSFPARAARLEESAAGTKFLRGDSQQCFLIAADRVRALPFSRAMNLELQEKVVLISGGASGIGAAAARAFVAEGASVAVVDRDAARGETIAAELTGAGARAIFIEAELINDEACRSAVLRTERTWGAIDILVNNAGINDHVALDRSSS